MRFKIGDMVSVRSDIDNFRHVDGIFLFKAMRKQRGRVERIIGAVDEGEQGFYKLNGSGFWWPGAMLNEVDMTEFNTPAHYVLEDGSDSMDVVAKILGREQFKGFLRGNALKYLIRFEQKGGVEDLKKALDYIERLVELEEDLDDEEYKKKYPGGARALEVEGLCKSDSYSIVEVAEALKRHLKGLD